MPLIYPETQAGRDRWIVAQRPARNPLDPRRPYAFFNEQERSRYGEIVSVSTILLTNRECPWRCLMCDLWRNTLTEPVPNGAIPEQIQYALQQLAPARELKLYNSGSFFDRSAIPLEDYAAIANLTHAFERMIVESHPALIGETTLQFNDLLRSPLEVAMGLETVHPEILPRLNKRMTLPQFAAAARYLQDNRIGMRAFVLIKPPFMREEESLEWSARSLDFAFACGATAVTLIPTRAGNGAMDALTTSGDFSAPELQTVELALRHGIGLKKGRVFLDLWDLDQLSACTYCYRSRKERLYWTNLTQTVLPPISCRICGAGN